MAADCSRERRTVPTAGDAHEPSSWSPIDLAKTLAGTTPPPPTLLRRSDGSALLYARRVHWLQGESESCKSWAALFAAYQVLDAGGRVLWIDFEDDESGIVERLRAFGVDDETIRTAFVYVRPDEPLFDQWGKPTAADDDFAALIREQYTLAVVDGVTEAMVTEGLNPIDTAETAMFMRRLPRRLVRTGAAVVCLDHVPKGEQRGKGALGSQHKRAGVTGASYTLDLLAPFYRPRHAEKVEGAVRVRVDKDRHGHVRGVAADDGTIGVLLLTASLDGAVRAQLVPAEKVPRPAPPRALLLAILGHLALYDGASARNIEEAVLGKADTIRAAVTWMALTTPPWLTVETKGRTHCHHLTDEGRRQFEAAADA